MMKVYFIGFLANTNSSILKIKLEHGFEIKAMSDQEGAEFCATLETLPVQKAFEHLFIEFSCVNSKEKSLYFVSNSFDCDIDINNKGRLTKFPNEVGKFDNNLVHKYLQEKIRLLRLFKEGNICIPLKYYYYIHNNKQKSFIRSGTSPRVDFGPEFVVDELELSSLQEFINNKKLPFTRSFLELAFENFELSYQTPNRALSFLALTMSLETLLNPGNEELKYRVSRNAAILLGKGKDESKFIYPKIKNLYDKRSQVIHTGNSKTVNEKDVMELRNFVREAIKKIDNANKDKNELLEELNCLGFGDFVG